MDPDAQLIESAGGAGGHRRSLLRRSSSSRKKGGMGGGDAGAETTGHGNGYGNGYGHSVPPRRHDSLISAARFQQDGNEGPSNSSALPDIIADDTRHLLGRLDEDTSTQRESDLSRSHRQTLHSRSPDPTFKPLSDGDPVISPGLAELDDSASPSEREGFSAKGKGRVSGLGERDKRRLSAYNALTGSQPSSTLRRNSSTRSRHSNASSTGPRRGERPVYPEHAEALERTMDHEDSAPPSKLNYIPLVFALVPPLGAVIHGRSDAWTDFLMLLVLGFYLYRLVKDPWELYNAARSKRVSGERRQARHEQQDPRRRAALTELRRTEIVFLVLTFLIPVGGGALLHGIRSLFSDQNRFLTTSTINLFMLSSGIKPLLHAVKLLKARSLHLQQIVHTLPSAPDDVDYLRDHVANLEDDIEHLRRSLSLNATKTDVRTMSKTLEPQFAQLGKAVRRYERREEFARLETDERFHAVESKLGQLDALTQRASQLLQLESYCQGDKLLPDIRKTAHMAQDSLKMSAFDSSISDRAWSESTTHRNSSSRLGSMLLSPIWLMLMPIRMMQFGARYTLWGAQQCVRSTANGQRVVPLLANGSSIS